MSALTRYAGFKETPKHREVTFEYGLLYIAWDASFLTTLSHSYALLDGINDTYNDMQDLVKLIEKFPAHVNLIPVNLWPEKRFHASPIDKAMGYLHEFHRLGISCSIRTPPRFPKVTNDDDQK
jgi:adenine C2-methylase RlmN of 23S rRNA A2503 and tRNA A37